MIQRPYLRVANGTGRHCLGGHRIDRSGVLKLEGQVLPEMVSQRTLVGVIQRLSSHCEIDDRGRLTYEDVFQLGLGARQIREPLDEWTQSCRRL